MTLFMSTSADVFLLPKIKQYICSKDKYDMVAGI